MCFFLGFFFQQNFDLSIIHSRSNKILELLFYSRQERLEFLYDSGLAVGKGSSSGSGFKALESSSQKTDSGSAPPSSSASSSKVFIFAFSSKFNLIYLQEHFIQLIQFLY